MTGRYAAAGAEVIFRTMDLAAVPAPTFREARRAEVLQEWWTDKDLEPRVDDAGNVWARVRRGMGGGLVVCAHMDTVFDESVSHVARIEGDRMLGPGVGDDTVALAALTVLPDILPETGDETWLLATVAEEGLGNLQGIRSALDDPLCDVTEVLAIEGNYLGRVVTKGVGSVRWNMSFTGPGGHAWESAGSVSAVHEAARAVAALDDLGTTAHIDGRLAVNVGTIRGGEAINALARDAECKVDLRADDTDALRDLELRARAVVEQVSRVAVSFDEIGRRPAGSIASDHPLARAASRALETAGIAAIHSAASTDANAAYERGIPAVTIGVTTGEKQHTESEWIALPPIETGLEAMANTIVNVWNDRS